MINHYKWYDNGLSVLGGPLLEAYQALDRCFVNWAIANYQAQNFLFPTFISAKELGKIDYFKSFPHLISFPVSLAPAAENLKRFIDGVSLSLEGALKPTETAPIYEILTPASCYHVYVYLKGKNLDKTTYITTVNNCFRREEYYQPLQRQWNFHMREIICLGLKQDVEIFLNNAQTRLTQFCQTLGLLVDWDIATDPFFEPEKNPKYFAQVTVPTKRELLFQDLAIGSANFHRDHFGKNFGIALKGEPLHTGCIAFGLERWIYALQKTFGDDVAHWPDLDSIKL